MNSVATLALSLRDGPAFQLPGCPEGARCLEPRNLFRGSDLRSFLGEAADVGSPPKSTE